MKNKKKKRILATDLDRTLLPNGPEKENRESRALLKNALEEKPETILVFVTGRRLELVKKAIKKYGLPMPKYCICSVGTEIFESTKTGFRKAKQWDKKLSSDWKGFGRRKVERILEDVPGLEVQEKEALNKFKQSYYVRISMMKKALFLIEKRLVEKGMKAKVVSSIDANKNVGLVDVLPRKADKLEALLFVAKKLRIKKSELLYCGESGNDLDVMVSGIKSVVVKNALPSFKRRVREKLPKKFRERVYFARGCCGLNGNYSSGIIEGAIHFNFL